MGFFDLTTAQWLFCSAFAGICTVLYMCNLFEKEKIEEQMKQDEEQFNNDMDKVIKFLQDNLHEVDKEEDYEKEDDEKEE